MLGKEVKDFRWQIALLAMLTGRHCWEMCTLRKVALSVVVVKFEAELTHSRAMEIYLIFPLSCHIHKSLTSLGINKPLNVKSPLKLFTLFRRNSRLCFKDKTTCISSLVLIWGNRILLLLFWRKLCTEKVLVRVTL
jgi:hypothetical protein